MRESSSLQQAFIHLKYTKPREIPFKSIIQKAVLKQNHYAKQEIPEIPGILTLLVLQWVTPSFVERGELGRGRFNLSCTCKAFHSKKATCKNIYIYISTRNGSQDSGIVVTILPKQALVRKRKQIQRKQKGDFCAFLLLFPQRRVESQGIIVRVSFNIQRQGDSNSRVNIPCSINVLHLVSQCGFRRGNSSLDFK